jgi:hypothetical protein
LATPNYGYEKRQKELAKKKKKEEKLKAKAERKTNPDGSPADHTDEQEPDQEQPPAQA